MLELIKDIFNRKNNLNQYIFRKAHKSDVDFVVEQLIYGAKHNHYLKVLLDPYHQKTYRTMFLRLLEGQGTKSLNDDGSIEMKSGSLWIYSNKKIGNVGYVFLSEKYEGSGENEIELLMAGIKSEYQGMGHGYNLIKCVISLCSNETTLYARCYQASKGMYHILKKLGFVTTNTRSSGTRELEYNQRMGIND